MKELKKTWEYLKKSIYLQAFLFMLAIYAVGLFFLPNKIQGLKSQFQIPLITISTFYGSIILGYVSQSIQAFKKEKEELLIEVRSLSLDLNSYRNLVEELKIHLNFNHHKQYREASTKDLEYYDYLKKFYEKKSLEFFDGDLTKETFFTLNECFKALKIPIFEFSHRPLILNNKSINKIITIFNFITPFQQLRQAEESIYNDFLEKEKIVDSKYYLYFRSLFVDINDVKVNLYYLEKNIFEVLLKLYDKTYLIEKPVPSRINFLFFTTLLVLVFGTIINLSNLAFGIFENSIPILIFTTLASIVTSVIMLGISFFDEHNRNIYRYKSFVYEGYESSE